MNRMQMLSRTIKIFFRGVIIMPVVALAFACSTQKSGVAYYEDLTATRPVVTNTTTPPLKSTVPSDTTIRKNTATTVNGRVDQVLDSIDRINVTKKYIDGFTIQIYSGQKREDAMLVKQRMANEAGGLASSLQYIQPKFRVTVGSYLTRMEAQKDLVRLKRHFSSAILVPEKILLK